jgi:hypothetical protein
MWSKIRLLPLRTLSYCRPSLVFIRPMRAIRSCLSRESRPVLPPTQRSLSWQIMKARAPWSEVMASSQNSRMLEQLTLRTPLTIDATKEQDLDPRPCSYIEHPSVLAHEMMKIEPGEKPSRKLTLRGNQQRGLAASCVVLTMTAHPCLFGRRGSAQPWVSQFRP